MKLKNMYGIVFSGTIGKCVTACVRDGYNYQREWVKPQDRKSPLQLRRRELFKKAMEEWNALSREERNEYNHRARKIRMHGDNLFLQEYLAKADGKAVPVRTEPVPNLCPFCAQPVPKKSRERY